MDRNTVIGFILIFLLVIVYSIYNQKKVAEYNEQQKHIQDSLEQIRLDSLAAIGALGDTSLADSLSQAIVPGKADTVATAIIPAGQEDTIPTRGFFGAAMQGEDKLIHVENDLYKITFSTHGAIIRSVELKGYKTFYKKPLVLFSEGHNQYGLAFYDNERNYIHSDSLYFEPSDSDIMLSGEDTATLVFRAPAGKDGYLEFRYTFSGSKAMIDFDIRFHKLESVLSLRQPTMTFIWTADLNLLERDLKHEQQQSTIYYRIPDETPDYLSERKEYEDKALKYSLQWVSYKQQFFNSTLITDQPFSSGRAFVKNPDSGTIVKKLRTVLYMPLQPGEVPTYSLHFYFGPNKYYELAKLGIELERIVPLGSSILGFINRHFILPVFTFMERYIGNYGLIILLLAIFIKLILTPLTFRSYRSQAKMRIIKPEVDALREKYKNDMQKFQMEQMKLYRKAGVSVLGGCLPMLLQLPILIAMYRFFPGAFNLRQESFLWVQDFTTYDSIIDLGFNIPFYGDHVSLFTILMTASSILYARMNSQLTGASGQMKYFQYFFPIMLLFIFNSFSAALTYYYFLYNILTFGQTWFFQKFLVNEEAMRKQMAAAAKSKPKKRGRLESWQKRMEQMQREKQQQTRRKR